MDLPFVFYEIADLVIKIIILPICVGWFAYNIIWYAWIDKGDEDWDIET